MKIHVLAPIKERIEDYEHLEAVLGEFFREEIYLPLLVCLREEFGLDVGGMLSNAKESDDELLVQAVRRGQIRFYRGHFEGRFTSKLSRALRRMGAQWDRKHGRFLIPHSSIQPAVQQAIAVSESRFRRVAERITHKLGEALRVPPELLAKLNLEGFFDTTIFRTDKDIRATLKGISVMPELSKDARERIASEYSKTLYLPIKDFVQKETEELRARISEKAFAGARYETIIGEIQRSYGVSQRKAKFLARQETSLLMTKLKQVRYQEAGSDEYIWGCVAGTYNHPVRHYHRQNEHKKFRWDKGAPINAQGDRKNPGQDWNCRCFAKPIVKF